ncbi:hypothetical protein SAMN05216186_106124 [Pseudomonas indica]|uniref:Metallo-beta-lactamase superfamily protein n=1 Tax=Pseudomonas indica TaxID=137658 RepID=A0A1G9B2H9_9PSED|nr:hypothetical protein SAMN05216186_106124 [Pseudomonas indica]
MQIRQCFGIQLGDHRREQEEFSRYASVDILFDERQTLLGNIDVIPPGHSLGNTCFLVHSPTGQRYLFTGDTCTAARTAVGEPALFPATIPPKTARPWPPASPACVICSPTW